ncbi:retrovirus-related pol polyprotein from transposon TNT 1-94 [Tanacetum coccineum]
MMKLSSLLSEEEMSMSLICYLSIKKAMPVSLPRPPPSRYWLWHKRLSHLNFKNINNLAKHNLVSGLPSLTFSKDKNCSAYEYSRYTWIFFLKKKSDAADCIMSFIRKIETLNEVRVKELRSDNGTEFRNHKLEEFCDKKGISHNFSSPCTPEQNGVAERRNRTLIEAARIMLNSAKLPKQFWGEDGGGVQHCCYTQTDTSLDHLGKFDEKADDGFFLGYSLVAKDFRVTNIRRKEMEETVDVTFCEDDEAISQSSTEGDAINFNENKSFPYDEFLKPMSEVTQWPGNTGYFPYIPAYENTTPSESPILQESVISEDPPEFTEADNHPALNKPDQTESADLFEPAEP